MSKVNPKIVNRPRILKWCYTPEDVKGEIEEEEIKSEIEGTDIGDVEGVSEEPVAVEPAAKEPSVEDGETVYEEYEDGETVYEEYEELNEYSLGELEVDPIVLEGTEEDESFLGDGFREAPGLYNEFQNDIVRLRKVVFSSQSCEDCYDNILSTTLHGPPIGSHRGFQCKFEKNPQPYYKNNKITFDDASELGQCWEVCILDNGNRIFWIPSQQLLRRSYSYQHHLNAKSICNVGLNSLSIQSWQ